MIGVGQDNLHLTGQQLLRGDAFHGCLGTNRHEHRGREYPMGGGNAAEASPRSRVACENLKAEWHRRMLSSAEYCGILHGRVTISGAMFINVSPQGSVSICRTHLRSKEVNTCPGITAAPVDGPPPVQSTDGMVADTYNGSRRFSSVSNLAYSLRNARSTSPVGPLRCFPTMILAMPLSLVSLL